MAFDLLRVLIICCQCQVKNGIFTSVTLNFVQLLHRISPDDKLKTNSQFKSHNRSHKMARIFSKKKLLFYIIKIIKFKRLLLYMGCAYKNSY